MVRIVLLALGLAAALSSGAGAQEAGDDGLAIATLTAVSGSVRDRLRPFTSFDAPVTLDLGADGKVTLVHHRTCEKLDISSGTVRIAFAGIEATGIVTRRDTAPCPSTAMAETSGVAGGVLMRSSRASGPAAVTVVLQGGPRLKAGSAIQLTVTATIDAAIFVFDQDQSGVLSVIQSPPVAGGRTTVTRAGTAVAVPDRQQDKIQVASDPGEGRVIAFAVPPETAPCGYLDLFEKKPSPGTLVDLSAALRDRARTVAACAPVPRRPVAGDLLYTIAR